jgi:hypothetical protein
MLQQHTKEHKMTKEELVAQCLADNPVMTQTNNDVERELSEEERLEVANAWADMRLEQIALEEQLAAEAVAKAEAEAAEEAAKQQAFNDAVSAAVAAALAAQQTP